MCGHPENYDDDPNSRIKDTIAIVIRDMYGNELRYGGVINEHGLGIELGKWVVESESEEFQRKSLKFMKKREKWPRRLKNIINIFSPNSSVSHPN